MHYQYLLPLTKRDSKKTYHGACTAFSQPFIHSSSVAGVSLLFIRKRFFWDDLQVDLLALAWAEADSIYRGRLYGVCLPSKLMRIITQRAAQASERVAGVSVFLFANQHSSHAHTRAHARMWISSYTLLLSEDCIAKRNCSSLEFSSGKINTAIAHFFRDTAGIRLAPGRFATAHFHATPGNNDAISESTCRARDIAELNQIFWAAARFTNQNNVKSASSSGGMMNFLDGTDALTGIPNKLSKF